MSASQSREQALAGRPAAGARAPVSTTSLLRQPEVEEAALRPDRLGDLADEGDDVVVGRPLDLGDALDVDARALPRSPRARPAGTRPRARLRAGDGDLDAQHRARSAPRSVQIAPISGSV